MEQDETTLVFLSMELSNWIEVFKDIIHIIDNLIIVEVWIFGIGVIPQLPVVERICLSIIKNWLFVVETVGQYLHGKSQLFWQITHSSAVVFSLEEVQMAWL